MRRSTGTKRRDLLLGIVFVSSVVAASCTGGGASDPPDVSAAPTTPTTSTVSTSAASDVTEAESSVTEPREAPDSRIRELLDVPPIELLTAESGGGTRPELAWEPVDEAFFYNVVLLDPTGRGYWGWEGTATAVHVGGEPVIKEGLSGPSVIDGMSWQVAAYDSDLNLIALSRKQPIAP
jgi:hypothetical protein